MFKAEIEEVVVDELAAVVRAKRIRFSVDYAEELLRGPCLAGNADSFLGLVLAGSPEGAEDCSFSSLSHSVSSDLIPGVAAFMASLIISRVVKA